VSVLFEPTYVPLEALYPALNETPSVAVMLYPAPTSIDPTAVNATEDPLMLSVQSHVRAVPVLSDPPEFMATAPLAET